MLNIMTMKPSQKVNETRVSLHGTKTHFGRVNKADDETVRPSEMSVISTCLNGVTPHMTVIFSVSYIIV